MKIAIVIPHMYMWEKIMKNNIFAPGPLALDLADGLIKLGQDVTVYSFGEVITQAKNIFCDTTHVESVLDKYESLDNLIIHELQIFKESLNTARNQILRKVLQEENKYDVVHIYLVNDTSEFHINSKLRSKVLYTLHDPLKLIYESTDKLSISQNANIACISRDQGQLLKNKCNVQTIHHGIKFTDHKLYPESDSYFSYFGRIIKPKGVDTAIKAVKSINGVLKIAGLHYEGHGEDHYWSEEIEPSLDKEQIIYKGFLTKLEEKDRFLGRSKALLMPIRWDEPFGMVILEANACGTPVIGFNRGSLSEVIKDGVNGYLVNTFEELIEAMERVDEIDREKCRDYAKKNFSVSAMVNKYLQYYQDILSS